MMVAWILGILLILISNPARIISKIEKFEPITKPFYGLKHIRKAISLTSDRTIINKLKRKIILRKTGYSLLISTLVFFILGGIFHS